MITATTAVQHGQLEDEPEDLEGVARRRETVVVPIWHQETAAPAARPAAHPAPRVATLLALAPPAPDVTHVMTPEHGFPVRLVVPPLYGWKGPKWARGIEYMTRDRRGFWEERGYHNIGEVRREQRYSYQEEPGEGPVP
ncbi:molybdopterin-dependent oxidoreductase [Streptomyces sp. NPDC006385]|uniref:molybdopterin-dependent oxidoreductase n=1 Tax=Streptomyces sp. NPDC006385 TaxID=3156761 RepID=UPI0033BAAC83